MIYAMKNQTFLDCHSQNGVHVHKGNKKKIKNIKIETHETSRNLIWIKFRNTFLHFEVHMEDIFLVSICFLTRSCLILHLTLHG